MKLYRVILQGGGNYRFSYVVAQGAEEAYQKVRKYLDEKHYCFTSERKMESVELLADSEYLGESETMLFM